MMNFLQSLEQNTIIVYFWNNFFLYNILNKYISIIEHCVSYRNDELLFHLQPSKLDLKIIVGTSTKGQQMTLM